MLDESVWEELSHRLQDPNLVLEAYQQHQAKRRESTQDEPEDATRQLDAQIKSANRELSRLLDAYQGSAIELTELQKRRRLVDAKLETLRREKDVLTTLADEQQKQTDLKRRWRSSRPSCLTISSTYPLRTNRNSCDWFWTRWW